VKKAIPATASGTSTIHNRPKPHKNPKQSSTAGADAAATSGDKQGTSEHSGGPAARR
jgi:hypothetical protein